MISARRLRQKPKTCPRDNQGFLSSGKFTSGLLKCPNRKLRSGTPRGDALLPATSGEAPVEEDHVNEPASRHVADDPRSTVLRTRKLGIKQSAVRDVFELSLDPSLVSLAGGNPYLQVLPLEKIGDIAQRIITEQGPIALQYGSGLGTPELREQILEVMAAEGITNVSVDDVVVTNGSQSAQDMACKVFCNPGDTVLCEDPTYVGALNTFEAYQVNAAPVLTDEHGLVPEALRAKIDELRAAGERIKFLYTIPNFNNPSGITLAAERRPEIVEICREAGVLILEDNPYGMPRYEGEAAPTLRSLDEQNVIYMGSFSKIFSPGARIG